VTSLTRIAVLQLLHHFKVYVSVAAAVVDHPPSGVVYSYGGVCLYVCNMITFESLDVGSSFLLIRYIANGYGSSSYMKVIGSRVT